MNEGNTSAAGSEAVSSSATTETVVQPDPVDRPLMTTSFSDYTVTEGLLLLILITLIVGLVFKGIKDVL